MAYDAANGNDPADIMKGLNAITLTCDTNKIELFFQLLENKMMFHGVKSQYVKLQVLSNVLGNNPKLLKHIQSIVTLP